MTISKTIPVFFGDTKITELHRARIARREGKVVVCPHCMKYINLGRWNSKEPWSFQQDDTFGSSKLKIRSEEEYKKHMMKCHSPLNLGINRIDKNSDPATFSIVEQLAIWSRRDTRWDVPQVCEGDFSNEGAYGLGYVIAYVFKNEIGPLSYVAYRHKKIILNNNETDIMVAWDLFMFKEFRHQGFARKLIEYSLNDLDIDRSLLPISYPVTKESVNLTKKMSTDKILCLTQEGYFIIDKDELGSFSPI